MQSQRYCSYADTRHLTDSDESQVYFQNLLLLDLDCALRYANRFAPAYLWANLLSTAWFASKEGAKD